MLTLVTSSNTLIVYGFCRRFVDSPRSMVDDVIKLVINYYDCDVFDETCITKYLSIENKNNLSTIQVKKSADQDRLQFAFGTKTIVINCSSNIYGDCNGYNYNKSDCKTDRKILSQKWNLIVDGRHKKYHSKSHVCCGIGIMNVNDIKCLQKGMKKPEETYGVGTGKQCYHSDIARLYKHLDRRILRLGPLGGNRFKWIESNFIGFCCIPVNTRYNSQQSFHSIVACNQMRFVKCDYFEKKNQCLFKKGDKIELSIELEKGEHYLFLRRQKCSNGCDVDSGWKCLKQSLRLLQGAKYQLVVWLKDKKTRIQVI